MCCQWGWWASSKKAHSGPEDTSWCPDPWTNFCCSSLLWKRWHQPYVSWEKYFITVRTQQGKERRQKIILIMNLKEAHVLFLNESDCTIGFSKFCQLRLQHVLPLTLRDHEQCMCRYHENIELLACGIKKLCQISLKLLKMQLNTHYVTASMRTASIADVILVTSIYLRTSQMDVTHRAHALTISGSHVNLELK